MTATDGRKPKTRLLAAVVVLAESAPAARADTGLSPGDCIWPNYNAERPLVVEEVRGVARVRFVKDAWEDASCPSPAASCLQPSFLVPGNAVLAGPTHGDFVCVFYQAANAHTRDATMDWLPASALSAIAPMPAEKASDWIGHWGHPGGEIGGERGLPPASRPRRWRRPIGWRGPFEPGSHLQNIVEPDLYRPDRAQRPRA